MKLTAYQERELKRAAEWGHLSWRSTETLEKRGLVRHDGQESLFSIVALLHRKVVVTVAGVRVLLEAERRAKTARRRQLRWLRE